MASPEETMLQEALAAAQVGDRARARDLFTRLLKIDQAKAEYWLWMSALVDTPRERNYCLTEAARLEPNSVSVRRGMMIAGLAAPDEAQIVPQKLQRRSWENDLLGTENPEKALAASSLRLTLGLAAGFLVLAVLVVAGIISARTPKYGIVYVTEDLSARPSATFLPTASPVVRSPTPTFMGPTPLWMQMKVTYTPTPLYVNTPHAVSESYRIALRAYNRADWVNLETYMLQVATLQPESADVLYYVGEANRFQKKYPAALGFYNKAIAVNANFAPAYLGRARAVLASDPTARVEPLADLQLALAKDPQLGEAYLELSALLLADRKYTEANLQLDRAAEVLPGSPLVALYRGQVLLKMGLVKEALAQAQTVNQLDVTLLPGYRLLAEALLANGRGGEAIELLNTYLQYVEDDGEAYVLLAQAYEAGHDLTAALNALDKALALNPRLAAAYQIRGRLHYTNAEYDAALSDFQYVLNLDKKNFAANMDMGRTLFQLKYYGDAYTWFEIGSGLAEGDREKAEVLYWRGQSLEKVNQPEAALRDYKALAQLKSAADPTWVAFAATQAGGLVTPTRTPIPPSPTLTRTQTRTVTPSLTPSFTPTRKATATQTPSRTATTKPKP